MAEGRGLRFKEPSVLPGFGLALGFTLTYLSLIVLIPLAAMILKAGSLDLAAFGRSSPSRARSLPCA
jgi:sulfate transport system permease protein